MAKAPTAETQGEQARQDDAARQLPLFQGFRLYRLEIALGGKLDLSLHPEDVQSIERALKLNGRLTVTLDLPGHPRPVQVEAVVDQRGYKLVKNPDTEAREPVTTAKVVIDPDAEPGY